MVRRLLRLALERTGYSVTKHEFLPFGIDFVLDMQRLASRRKVVIRSLFDVGANDGSSARKFLQAFPDACVHSFEPHPASFHFLEAAKGPRLMPHKMAVSDRCGRAKLFVYSAFSGEEAPLAPAATNNTLLPGQYTQSIDVDCITIDEFCKYNRIAAIDFLKIDTEGHDAAVLRGAKSMLKTISFVLCEFSSVGPAPGRDDALSQLGAELEPFGFQFVASYPVHTIDSPFRAVSNALFFAENRQI